MMNLSIQILLFVFLANPLFAQDLQVETYCFSSTSESLKAQSSAKYLMTSQDKIEDKNECFSLFTSSTRRELIQKYLLQNYPNMKVSFSSEERSASETCHIRVEKIKNSNTQRSTFSLKNAPGVQNSTSQGKETSQIKVLSGAPFELRVDQQKIEGKCRYINANQFEITFSMKFIPRPLIPPVPEGVTVVIQNPPQPETQTGTNLSTTIQLAKGQRVEMGSIVKDLNDKAQSASLAPEFKYEKTEGVQEEKIYLALD